jgi:PPM family protein phosphatase
LEITVAEMKPGMKYQAAQLSTSGGRRINEDRVSIAERGNSVLLVVADGLGGHSGGDVAAQTAVETVTRLFQAVRQPRIADPIAYLALTMMKAHHSIIARARAHVPPLEARTTCVLCLVQEGYAYWAHIGDSRLYHFRGKRVVRRTEDHTTIEELRRDGVISEEEMAQHPRKSYLLRSLGGSGDPRISLGEETPLQTGDTLLLCTDGLWEALTAEEMATFLSVPRIDDGVEEMLSAAEKRMGDACDNVTVATLKWEDRSAALVPRTRPAVAQVDTGLLWQDAVATKAVEKRMPEPNSKPDDKRDSIETRINELEEYLRRFEPKR